MDDHEEEGGKEDTPKMVATLIAKAPVMVIRIGWPYLKMKRRARSCSKRLRKELVEGGIPEHMAAQMAESYVSEISVRRLMQQFNLPGMKLHWEDDSP